MDAVPAPIDGAAVQEYLEALPEVDAVHHLHIWSIGSAEIALTAHVVRSRTEDHDAFLDQVAHELEERFGINHATVQVELAPGCAHDRDDHAPHH
jgi:cobalt-zinc-cadmium efflux system protein